MLWYLYLVYSTTMSPNNTIYVLDSHVSEVSILNIGSLSGISIATSLGIVSAIGLCIRALFIYYIHFDAPKDRPFNTLLWLDQVIMKSIQSRPCNNWIFYFSQIFQFVAGLVFSVLTIWPIATQTSLYQNIGRDWCHFYWIVNALLGESIFIGSLGMAIFRIICVNNLMMDVNWRRDLVKYILAGEVGVGIVLGAVATCIGFQFGSFQFGYCMNYGNAMADVLHQWVIHHYFSYFQNNTIFIIKVSR